MSSSGVTLPSEVLHDFLSMGALGLGSCHRCVNNLTSQGIGRER